MTIVNTNEKDVSYGTSKFLTRKVCKIYINYSYLLFSCSISAIHNRLPAT